MNHPEPSSSISEILGEESPGWLERSGIQLFHWLARRHHLRGKDLAGPAFEPTTNDDVMAAAVRKILAIALTLAFIAGAISAGGSVYAETLFPENACDAGLIAPLCLQKYGLVIAVTLILSVIELCVLVVLSVWVVFHLARITGHHKLSEDTNDAVAARIPNLLARAALEIPDPVREVLGIDPMRGVPKRVFFVVGFLYKLKIVASNVIAKLILRRVFGKSAVRVSIAYIAVPITGIWNAIVTYRVAREARLRLFGSLLARHLVDRELNATTLAGLSGRARLGCLQAVGNAIVFARSNHPNMVILLARLYDVLRNDLEAAGETQLDDWAEFLRTLIAVDARERIFLLNLLAIAAAFDGRISFAERKHLGAAFQDDTAKYFERIRALQRALLKGRLNAAKDLCVFA